MPTCRDIITRALRMSEVIGRSEEPDAEELQDGMIVLQSLYLGWFTSGMFGKLCDVYEQGDYDAGENQRVYLEDGVVTLPETIDEDRKPRDLVAVEVDSEAGAQIHVWDRTKWVRLDSLEPTDDAPLANRGPNGLAACLAMNFCEEFGAPIKQSMALQARAFKSALSLKYGTTQGNAYGQYF